MRWPRELDQVLQVTLIYIKAPTRTNKSNQILREDLVDDSEHERHETN